jgi:hypothetical protein
MFHLYDVFREIKNMLPYPAGQNKRYIIGAVRELFFAMWTEEHLLN